jgi:Uma2 family endonuclease
MYGLPSEEVVQSGLPDEFHALQPQLLSATFQPEGYSSDQVFSAIDLNLYYDVEHLRWYKRPDWFAVVGVSSLYGGTELRQSYVRWQKQKDPIIVVELLSPGTEDDDLGQGSRDPDHPPSKWDVYERILKAPHYVVFDNET